jgi:hypothetical protein
MAAFVGRSPRKTDQSGTILKNKRSYGVIGIVLKRPALRLGRGGGTIDTVSVAPVQGVPATSNPDLRDKGK